MAVIVLLSIFYLQVLSIQRFWSCSPAKLMIPEDLTKRGIPKLLAAGSAWRHPKDPKDLGLSIARSLLYSDCCLLLLQLQLLCTLDFACNCLVSKDFAHVLPL